MRHLTLSFLVCLTACLASCQTQNSAHKLLEDEGVAMERIIPLTNNSPITFRVPHKTKVTMQLLTNPHMPSLDRIPAALILRDDDCKVGHQASLFYSKPRGETQYEYFAKELPWDTDGILTINRSDESTDVSITLNGETHKIQPRVRTNYLRITSYPRPITIVEATN
jgi:hypothetical protein